MNSRYARALIISTALAFSSCAPKNPFVGTWKLTSSSRPLAIDHIVIDTASVQFFDRDGEQPTYPYTLVNDHEALMQGLGMTEKLELTGPNALHASEDDSVFLRQ
jgi:hypothetical protein